MDLIDRLSQGFKAYILLALLTFAAAWPGVMNMPVLDRDEARFAQASRQMVQSGDYVTIQFQDELRNKKPAGIHWLQAASVSLFSDPDSNEIWPYRLPSLIGAMLAVCLCFWLGSGLIGRPAAFLGTSLFATSMLLTTEAHIAKTDAALVATACLLFGALSKLYLQSERPVRWSIIAWVAAALSILLKGPVIIGLAAATLLGLFALERRANWMKPLLAPQGWLLFLLIALPWFVLVQIQTGGAYLDGALGKDFADKIGGASEGHGGPPGYHTLFLLTHFFPGTLFLVPGFIVMFRAFRARDRSEPNPVLLLSMWLAATWIVFELLPTKLSHYVLPAYPALALLCGLGIASIIKTRPSIGVRAVSVIPFVLGAAVLLYVSRLLVFYSLIPFDFHPDIVFTDMLFDRFNFGLFDAFWFPSAIFAGLALASSVFGAVRLSLILALLCSLNLGPYLRGNLLPEVNEI
ncbi:MAG: glycosyltransferase family 39 protein, partial [Pseudomonadota bacterium]